MKPEQKIIARWMEFQRDRLATTWDALAKKMDGVNPTTLSRAVKPDYESVSSVTTLHKMARVVGVPSVLDFLERQTQSEALPASISEELLCRFLLVALNAGRPDPYSEDEIRGIVQSLKAAAAKLERLPGVASDPARLQDFLAGHIDGPRSGLPSPTHEA